MRCYHRAALIALVFLTAGIHHVKSSQQVIERVKQADLQVTRLPPSAFPALPAKIRRELERRGCTVPQVSPDKKPQNVIRGEFTSKGRADWAVLCSVNRVSTVLIFRNASARELLELAPQSDADNLQSGGGTAMEYSRAISPIGREYILQHYRPYGGPEPPAIDHQGINDAFVGKGSVVHYFYAGKWRDLTGAD
jgi:hypothetical protein